MLRRRAWFALAVLAVAALPACGGGDAESTELDSLTDMQTFRIRATMRGDGTATFSGDREVQFVRVRPTGSKPAEQSIVGFEFAQPLAAEGKAARFSVTIIPFSDDGTFRIPEGSRRDADKENPVKSTIQVYWWPDAGVEDFTVFERRGKDCTVKIDDLGMKGSAKCPQLLSEDGSKKMSVELDWRKV
ncbi:MAG: hypothetical protein KY443_02465 [Actinobacteria bacterium]|nr:hypothetical protein [Actinomycetota bacterium]